MRFLFFFKIREDNQFWEEFNTEDIVIRKGTCKICICCQMALYQMYSLVTICGSAYKQGRRTTRLQPESEPRRLPSSRVFLLGHSCGSFTTSFGVFFPTLTLHTVDRCCFLTVHSDPLTLRWIHGERYIWPS